MGKEQRAVEGRDSMDVRAETGIGRAGNRLAYGEPFIISLHPSSNCIM